VGVAHTKGMGVAWDRDRVGSWRGNDVAENNFVFEKVYSQRIKLVEKKPNYVWLFSAYCGEEM